ncbi:MAG: phage holin family protein [Ktedonobacteraceae bacterium]|nr:phage holin family protein [Ktedonobacteraceae bacterium]
MSLPSDSFNEDAAQESSNTNHAAQESSNTNHTERTEHAAPSAPDQQWEESIQQEKASSEEASPYPLPPLQVQETGQEEEFYPVSTLPQVPPEEREANGGPLGCCLGTVVGLLLTMLLITGVSLALANGGYLGAATLPVALLGAVAGGIGGWIVGKKIYREYEPPVVKMKKRTAKTRKI